MSTLTPADRQDLDQILQDLEHERVRPETNLKALAGYVRAQQEKLDRAKAWIQKECCVEECEKDRYQGSEEDGKCFSCEAGDFLETL